jgi:hypothetical protein
VDERMAEKGVLALVQLEQAIPSRWFQVLFKVRDGMDGAVVTEKRINS